MAKDDELSRFKCLRCSHEYTGVFRKDAERTCPKCRSNSVRHLRGKVTPGAKEETGS